MKKLTIVAILIAAVTTGASAQGFKNIFKKDSTGKTTLGKILESKNAGSSSQLGTNEIAAGLKEALQVGVQKGSNKLSAVNGFFADAAIKILMPPEAVSAEKKLRALGFGNQVDNAILTMNRAAEDAAKSASPIFVNAIKQMSFQDALGILKGGDFAATNYLKNSTTLALTNAFKPVIEQSLKKVDATKYWSSVFSTYNKFTTNKVNPDLTAYVTEKALTGIFYQVGLEEQQIRKDPISRTSDLLKKVFGTL